MVEKSVYSAKWLKLDKSSDLQPHNPQDYRFRKLCRELIFAPGKNFCFFIKNQTNGASKIQKQTAVGQQAYKGLFGFKRELESPQSSSCSSTPMRGLKTFWIPIQTLHNLFSFLSSKNENVQFFIVFISFILQLILCAAWRDSIPEVFEEGGGNTRMEGKNKRKKKS